MARSKIKKVRIADIVFDLDLYPRVAHYWQTSYQYKEEMLSGARFPPITLALLDNKLILVDGKHRLEAVKSLKQEFIEADILEGLDRKQIYLEAIKRNIAHGQKLSPFEKRKAILKLRELKLSPSEISRLIQVPESNLQHFVGQRLISSTTGEEIIGKSGVKHLAGKTFSGSKLREIEVYQLPINFRNQVDLLDRVIELFESGMIDKKNIAVLERIERLTNLLFIKQK